MLAGRVCWLGECPGWESAPGRVLSGFQLVFPGTASLPGRACKNKPSQVGVDGTIAMR